MSAMEHAVPEQFWVDRSQCRYIDETGQVKNPALPDCGQAVSAVKAIAIAQSQGQKIYTITQQNASTALVRLPVGGSVGQEIRNAVLSGKEVTVHEKPITTYGWSGHGYSIIDPETGSGGYLIEGSGNGGEFRPNNDLPIASMILCVAALVAGLFASAGFVAMLVFLSIAASLTHLYLLYLGALERAKCDSAITCIQAIFILGAALEIVLGVVGLSAVRTAMNFQNGGTILAIGGIINSMGGSNIPSSIESACNNLCREPIPNGF
jgi:hypothetical protein